MQNKVSKKFSFKSKVIVWKAGNRDGDDKGAAAKIGKSEWKTSIFPDRHSNTYILPLKKEIRYQENLYDGIDIKVVIEISFK